MSHKPMVDILLGTFNGEKHVSDQIESILNQSYPNFRLLIRDDGSTDSTMELVASYEDARIVVVKDKLGNVGVAENFRILLKHAESQYAMFSDQDDVWFEDKVKKMLDFISNNEKLNQPCLAYSPGVIVDSALEPGKNEVYTVKRAVPGLGGSLFLNGGIQGCAMIMNRPLYSKVIEQELFDWYMHDQAITLYAFCFGNVLFYQKPLFYYRQHDTNVIGYEQSSVAKTIVKYFLQANNSFLIRSKVRKSIRSFYELNKDKLSNIDRESLEDYISLGRIKMITFIRLTYKHKWNLHGSAFRLIFKAMVCKRLID